MKTFNKFNLIKISIPLLFLLSLFVISNCSKKKEDNKNSLYGIALLQNSAAAGTAITDADGAINVTIPAALTILTPSSTTNNRIESSVSSLARDINVSTSTSTSTFTSISDVAKDQNRRQIFVEDPLSKNDTFQALNNLIQTTDLSGYRWILDAGAKTVTFSPPTSSAQQDGDTTGASTSTKSSWVVRAASSDGKGKLPIKVEMWGAITMNDGTTANTSILLTINSSKTDLNPWGSFLLQAIIQDSSNNIIAKFYAKTNDSRTDGKQEIEMIDMSPMQQGYKNDSNSSGGKVTARATWLHILRDPNNNDLTLVKSSVWNVINGVPTAPADPKYFKLVSNKTYIYTQVPDNTKKASDDPLNPTLKELILQRTNPNVAVYKYGLYFNDGINQGKRFIIKTGMPIEYTTGGVTYKGWAGVYGAHYITKTGHVALTDGATVTGKDLLTGQSLGTFTVKVYPGKLFKVTKILVPVSNYTNVRLQGPNPIPDAPGYGIAYYNGTKFVYEKTCVMSQAVETCTNLSTITEVPFQKMGNKSYVRLVLRGSGQNGGKELMYEQNSSNITEFIYQDVNSLSTDLKLKSYQTIAAPITTQKPTITLSNAQPPTQVDYFVSKNDLTLRVGTNTTGVAVTFDPSTVPAGGQAFLGMLMDNTSGNLPATASPMDQEVTYTWQTGTDKWTQKTVLLDSNGTPVKFDYPVTFLYQDPKTNDLTEVTYNGFGQLFVPMVAVDATNDKDFNNIRPKFIIPDGTILKGKVLITSTDGSVSPSTTTPTFIVKHLKKGERPLIITDKTLVQDLITQYNSIDANTALNTDAKVLLATITADVFATVPTTDTAPATVDGEKPSAENTSSIK